MCICALISYSSIWLILWWDSRKTKHDLSEGKDDRLNTLGLVLQFFVSSLQSTSRQDDWRHRVRVCCKLLGDMHICAGGCIPLCGSGSQVRGALTKFHVSSMSSKTWWSCCFSSHGKEDKVFFFNKGQTINLRTNLHQYGRALSFAGNWGAQEFMVH